MKLISFVKILIVTCSMLLLAGCHQSGCTDPHAINFNVTADQDDGSCIVCKTSVTPFDSTKVFLVDPNFNSIHYHDTVASFSLYQEIQQPSDKVCGEATSVVRLVITSMINQKMFLYYHLSTYNGPVNVNMYEQALIDPHQLYVGGAVNSNNNPPFLPISLDSINVVVYSGEIIYY